MLQKSVLLIGGGGTLGSYTAQELLALGHQVDVICLEDKQSADPLLRYFKADASLPVLTAFLESRHYDGIVNFLHYLDADTYAPVHELLCAHTDHLIFLSSYRVYADVQHPVTESAPHLLDTSDDQDFLAREDYAIAKARVERYLWNESRYHNWTIVRPVISFSQYRLDIVTRSGQAVVEYAKAKTPMPMPMVAKDMTAGLDWAGNSGKLIANLLFKPETLRQAYTVSSAQNLTWSQVADIYTKLLGVQFQWVDTDTYLRHYNVSENGRWTLIYDRFFDRVIDNRKILQATGLQPDDLTSMEDGLRIELSNLGISPL